MECDNQRPPFLVLVCKRRAKAISVGGNTFDCNYYEPGARFGVHGRGWRCNEAPEFVIGCCEGSRLVYAVRTSNDFTPALRRNRRGGDKYRKSRTLVQSLQGREACGWLGKYRIQGALMQDLSDREPTTTPQPGLSNSKPQLPSDTSCGLLSVPWEFRWP
jgi:hypothetical protein